MAEAGKGGDAGGRGRGWGSLKGTTDISSKESALWSGLKLLRSPGLTHSLCALYSLDLLLFPQSVSREEGQVLEYHLHYFPDAHPVTSPKSCVAPLAGARDIKGIQCAELQAAMLDWGAGQPSPSPAPDKRAQSPNPRHSALLESLYSEKAPVCLGFFYLNCTVGLLRTGSSPSSGLGTEWPSHKDTGVSRCGCAAGNQGVAGAFRRCLW